jgi:hypothetical protein
MFMVFVAEAVKEAEAEEAVVLQKKRPTHPPGVVAVAMLIHQKQREGFQCCLLYRCAPW